MSNNLADNEPLNNQREDPQIGGTEDTKSGSSAAGVEADLSFEGASGKDIVHKPLNNYKLNGSLEA